MEGIIEELHFLISVLVAVILGFAIGYERKLRFKEVGIRTHTIVCAGSALIMVVSKYGFGDSIEADASRVAVQIVSGIVFFGCRSYYVSPGCSIRNYNCAVIWMTAGIGMTVGVELYILAIGTIFLSSFFNVCCI